MQRRLVARTPRAGPTRRRAAVKSPTAAEHEATSSCRAAPAPARPRAPAAFRAAQQQYASCVPCRAADAGYSMTSAGDSDGDAVDGEQHDRPADARRRRRPSRRATSNAVTPSAPRCPTEHRPRPRASANTRRDVRDAERDQHRHDDYGIMADRPQGTQRRLGARSTPVGAGWKSTVRTRLVTGGSAEHSAKTLCRPSR